MAMIDLPTKISTNGIKLTTNIRNTYRLIIQFLQEAKLSTEFANLNGKEIFERHYLKPIPLDRNIKYIKMS